MDASVEYEKTSVEDDDLKMHLEEPEKSVRWTHIKPQILAVNLSTLIILHCGITLSFPNLVVNNLGIEVGSWYGCLGNFAIPIGSIFGGIIVDKIGRKMTNVCTTICCTVSWVMISLSKSDCLWLLYGASFVIGFSSGLASSNAVYVSEIAQKDYRAFFLSLIGVYYSLGILSTTILQLTLTWKQTALIYALFFSVLTVFIIFFTPESPLWLITFRNDRQKARWMMRRLYSNDQVREKEWNDLVEGVDSRIKGSDGRKKLIQISDPTVYKKPFCILIILMVLQQFSGIYISISFALKIFTELGPNEGQKYCNQAFLILGVSRFLLSVLNCFLSVRCGRKTLLIVSSLGMFLSCSLVIFLKFFFTSTNALELVIIFVFLLYLGTGCLGVATIPWSLSTELLPTEVRAIGSTVTSTCGLLLISGLAKLFPYILTTMGITWMFFVFGVVSAVLIPFTYFFIPETLGKSFNDIEKYFQRNEMSGNNGGTKTEINRLKQIFRA